MDHRRNAHGRPESVQKDAEVRIHRKHCGRHGEASGNGKEEQSMTRELTNKDVKEYLKMFKDDAPVSMIVVDVKNRKGYIGSFGAITDLEQPVFIFNVEDERPFDEDEAEMDEKDETPKIIDEDNVEVTYCCANCGQEFTQEKEYKSNYCSECGQRFIWKGETDE